MRTSTSDLPPTSGSPSLSPIRARLLGSVALSIGDRVLVDGDWPRRSARSLLLLLLATPGHALPRDRVLDTLWPENTPDAARNALYIALHALRRVLEPDLTGGRASSYVEAGADAIRIRAKPGCAVDVDEFEARLQQARTAPPADRRRLLRQAVGDYGGDLLADEPYVDWPVARRESLRQSWEQAVLDLADLDLAAGEPLAAVSALETLVAADETREDAYRALIRAFAAAGQIDRARRQYERCARALRDQLGEEPSASTQALMASLRDAPPIPVPPIAPQRTRYHLLPAPPTPLIGRDDELARMQDLLWDEHVRLVTLTGPGGIGKTHLALAVAAGVAGDFADGVVFVSLALLRDPALVMPTIARAFGVRDDDAETTVGERLADALRERTLLLVIDNFENVIEAATVVSELLATASGLKVMSTSRERLRLRGEYEVEVSPLPTLEPSRQLSVATVERNESAVLFRERVRLFDSGFAIIEQNAQTVAAICRRLDGIPLAIELAAVWLRDLSASELLTRLERRLPVLTEGSRDLPARLQTMRAAIAWSYDLLPETERTLFRRLSVFVGGAHIALIPAVTDVDEPAAALAALIAKHLIRVDRSAEVSRITILETVREFGTEQLAAGGEIGATRAAHAAAMASFAEDASAVIEGGDQLTWLDRLDAELDNLRAALEWSIGPGAPEIGLRILSALRLHWLLRGQAQEGVGWARRLTTERRGASDRVWARALQTAGELAFVAGSPREAVPKLETALGISLRLGDLQPAIDALQCLGDITNLAGNLDRATDLYRQGLALARQAGDSSRTFSLSSCLGLVANYGGQWEESRAIWREALAAYGHAARPDRYLAVIVNLAFVEFDLGNVEASLALAEGALGESTRRGFPEITAVLLAAVGEAKRRLGDDTAAAEAYEQAIEICRSGGYRRAEFFALPGLAQVHAGRGDHLAAIGLLRQGLTAVAESRIHVDVPSILEPLANQIRVLGNPLAAARLFAAANAIYRRGAVRRPPREQVDVERWLTIVRTELGESVFAAAWENGESLTLDAAVAEALALPIP